MRINLDGEDVVIRLTRWEAQSMVEDSQRLSRVFLLLEHFLKEDSDV